MEFAWTEEQMDVRDLARRILSDIVSDDAIKAFEPTGKSYLEKAWVELARAEILSLPLSEEAGGGGMSEMELSLVLREVGQVAAPVPVMGCLLFAALPLDRFGNAVQKSLARKAIAEVPEITGAWLEAASRDIKRPATTLSKTADGYQLNGVKTNVEVADVATQFVVNATLDGKPALVLVQKDQSIGIEAQLATNITQMFQLSFNNTPVKEADIIAVGDDAAKAIDWVHDRALMAQSSIMLGLAETALKLTSTHAIERKQFGMPIAMFQAVGQRAADCYIDVQTIELMTLKAAWLQSEGLPSTEAAQKAKFIAADGGHRVIHAASHIHGGMGFDRDYPLYRYFLTMKLHTFTLGGGAAQLAAIGKGFAVAPN